MFERSLCLKREHTLVVICRKIMMVKINRFWLGLVEKWKKELLVNWWKYHRW